MCPIVCARTVEQSKFAGMQPFQQERLGSARALSGEILAPSVLTLLLSFDMSIHVLTGQRGANTPATFCVASHAWHLAATVLACFHCPQPRPPARPWLQDVFQSMLHRGLILQEALSCVLHRSWQGLHLRSPQGTKPSAVSHAYATPSPAASQLRLVFPFAHPTHTCSVRPVARACWGCRLAL
jgi:hypothetical protein